MTDKTAPVASRYKLLSAAVLAAFVLAGCSGGNTEAPQKSTEAPKAAASAEAKPALDTPSYKGDPVAGKIVYENYCKFCHGNEGYGDGPIGTAITPHPANFVEDKERMAKSDAELYKSITKGIERAVGGEEMVMPRWQEILSDKERWDVLAYVRELHRKGNESKK